MDDNHTTGADTDNVEKKMFVVAVGWDQREISSHLQKKNVAEVGNH